MGFKESLAKGSAGEALLMQLWPDLEKLDGRRSDFKLKSTGQLLELKSDQYNMDSTENFFIELWSDGAKLKPGGPMQAMKHDSELWCYFFVQNRVLFIFKTNELVDWLLKHAHEYKRVAVLNKTYKTYGLKVPRTVLSSLYITKEYRNAG